MPYGIQYQLVHVVCDICRNYQMCHHATRSLILSRIDYCNTCSCIPRQWIQQRYASTAASHSCVRSNSCISRRISFKFYMEVYLGKIYTPIVFGDAAPSVPSFIGSNVTFWWKCVHSAGHIS